MENKSVSDVDRRSFIKTMAGGATILAMNPFYSPWASMAHGAAGGIKLPPLPYANNALAPSISSGTIDFHYGKHHDGYVTNLNKLIEKTELAELTIEEIIKKTFGKKDKVAIFNNAAQVWNHTFYWNSMKPGGGGAPSGRLKEMVGECYGDWDKLKEAFSQAAAGIFGSGWAWLVQDGRRLKIMQTSNADTPITEGLNPLITLDVWEHAYYLDYQNRRKDYIVSFLDRLINWDFAAQNLK